MLSFFLVEMKPVTDVLNDMGAKEFVSLIKSSGLEEKLDAQNMTIFVPSDKSMKEFEENMQERVSYKTDLKIAIL